MNEIERVRQDMIDYVEQEMSVADWDTPKAYGDWVNAMLEGFGELLGAALAEASDYGNIATSCKEKPNDKRRKWYLAIATNDAADQLQDWCERQMIERLAAYAALHKEEDES
jgi:hypothetical protein